MQLLDLHNDALLAVIQTLPDRALVNFSIACRRLFELAKPRVKDRKYTVKYGCIRLADDARDLGSHWDHPIELIHIIRQDPSVVKYIEEIQFSAPTDYEDPEPPTDHQETILQQCNYLKDELKRLVFLTRLEKHDWRGAVRELDKNVCFVVLLSLCVNAKSLVLVNLEELPVYLNSAVDYLCKEHAHSRTSEGDDSGHDLIGSNQLFPRLTKLEIRHWDTEIGMTLDQDYSLLEIPTLKSLSLGLVGHEECDEDWTWRSNPRRPCSVETVDAWHCGLKPQALVDLIQNMPDLQRFNYDNCFTFELGDDWNSVEEFAERVKVLAGNMLKERSLEVMHEGATLSIVKRKQSAKRKRDSR